ncbi:MAG: sugar phosphate isomerase/epimerase [Anaerolineae bacterium]|nr:sugar phosphate isomerase/epimerase [Anaerolineae bacterium]
MSQSTIGLNLYTLREFAQTAGDLADTLKKVKAAGYDYVQLSGVGPIDPKEVKTMLDGEGLGVCATHVRLDRLFNDLNAVVEEHLLWECKNAAIGGIFGPEWQSAEGYAHFAKEGGEIARRFAEHGITFSYHNHYHEFHKFGDKLGMEILAAGSEPMGFEIDTYWVQYGGADPAAWIEKMAGRAPLVHFKDMSIDKDRAEGVHIMAPVGEGNLNWPAILAACQKAGARWHIVEQDHHPNGKPFENVATSVRNMKEKMGLS